jgi:hypothetical protein
MKTVRRGWLIVAAFGVLFSSVSCATHRSTKMRSQPPPLVAAAEQQSAAPMHNGVSPKALALRQDMRKLWTDHVVWTRDYIIAAAAGTPVSERLAKTLGSATGKVATLSGIGAAVSTLSPGDSAAVRLLKNQEDIGDAIAVYYGEEAGRKLTSLLKKHILIAVDLISDAKKGNQKKFASDDAEWKANADEIADYLSSANPSHWPQATLRDMMAKHLSTTTDEVKARLGKHYHADAEAFDAVYDHILMMSDALSDGIIRQFPAQFS